MTDQILWFAARGAGVVSLILLTSVVCLGLLTVVRWQSPSWPSFLTVELHRAIALLSVVFLGIHIATAVLDPYASLGLIAAIVPLASTYRPVAVAFGVVAVDLMLAVLITSLVRERLGHRLWRAIHWLAYGAWPLAVLHGITAGSDAFAPWMLAVDGVCLAAAGGALVWRVRAGASPRRSLAGIVGDPTDPGRGFAGGAR